MNFLHNLSVLVLGLGDSGLAMARWCARYGANVSVWDSRADPPHAAALARDVPSARLLSSLPLPLAGEGRGEGAGAPIPSPQPSPASGGGIHAFQLVLKSPGLAPQDGRIAPLLQAARAAGIAVLGELDLFVQALVQLKLEHNYAPQVLAVTGTNGKTTVTALTHLLVQRSGKSAAVAGNIGPTLLDTLSLELDRCVHADAEQAQAAAAATGADPAPVLPEVWVLELSSFQLEGGGDGVRDFEPTAATVLNVTQDHLDWHGDMAAYTAAKGRVFGQQAVMVVNRDDAAVMAMVGSANPAPAASKSKTAPKIKAVPRQVLGFGLGAPQVPGDFGLVEENGMAWLVRALPSEPGVKAKKGEVAEIHLQRLMPADALRIRGRHNAANALAALALATSCGCALAPMLHGLRDYAGEPHRVQFVATVGEVETYDDSKGTNVGATVAALNGLGADKAPSRLVVILGGDGKGQDFAPLVAPLARHARAAATIGRDAALLEQVCDEAGVPVQRFVSLELAVNWGLAQAQPGDALLLSPACASLDMFTGYAQRAQVFVAAVQAHAADRGQV